MHRIATTVVLMIVLFIGFVTSADARKKESDFACFAYGTLVSQSLFPNTGTYGSKEPTLINVIDCTHKKTGLYGNIVPIMPLKNPGTGGEIDLRFGYRFSALGLENDISIAGYYFGVGNGEALATFDLKAKTGRTFSLTETVSLEAYGVADYQHSISLGTNSLGVAGGLTLGLKWPDVWGKPNLKLGTKVWGYPLKPLQSFGPGHGPIVNLTADLGIKIPNTPITIGPRARLTIGDVLERNSKKVRTLYGIFILIPFDL